ncbi:sigma-70 family RNA polymerase sigma factor [Lutibacter citreus]|uniref:sigma-70 family RNA polymerase sigma factor n=1 Tax=Lutibacter citreus TaxID=2138210 RepID=UPI000DBE56CE|nr:sigma-70 family RNA polymerase sigma factor [Lutibacter citreus]
MTTNQVWNKYSTDLKQFIISKVKDTTIADDILQDTFIKIHTNIHRLKDLDKLKPWVFSIARNSIMDYFKSKNLVFDLPELEINYELEEQDHSEKDCLRGILKNLPKKYRDPLFLSDIKGLKQQEVADSLNLPLPTVKSQIQRARKLIAKGFMDCCGYVINEKGVLQGELRAKKDCTVCNL